MPGSGKSTLGKALAKKTNYNFLDLDEQIVSIEKQSINDIFSLKGESYFRKIEQEILHSTQDLDKTIIACGGGTPCFYDNIDWINENGESVYLKVEIEELMDRLESDDSRPLLNSSKLQTIAKLLGTRKSFYEKASNVCNQCSLDELIEELNLI